MPKLSDCLSDSKRTVITETFIRPGSVFKIMDTETKPPKIKYHVIIGVNDTEVLVGTARINSKINPNIYRDIESKSRCMSLRSRKYGYLDHDSTIDCNHLITHKKSDVLKHLNRNSGSLLGDLDFEDLNEVKLRMIEAPTISEEDKERFGIVCQN